MTPSLHEILHHMTDHQLGHVYQERYRQKANLHFFSPPCVNDINFASLPDLKRRFQIYLTGFLLVIVAISIRLVDCEPSHVP